MKKLLPIATTLLLATVLIIASCTKKDTDPTGNYTCHCSIALGGTTTTADIAITNTKKSTATSSCASAQATYNSGGAVATCTLN